MRSRIDGAARDHVQKLVERRFRDDSTGIPVFFAVAGSHSQGVAGPASDIDLRGFHCVDGTQYLLLDDPEPQIRFTIPPSQETPEIEVVSHELRTFGSRLLKFHFNAVEPLFATDPVIRRDSAQVSAIRSSIVGALPGELPARYSGMARSLYDDYVSGDAPRRDELTVKQLLYTLRGALAARYVEEQNGIEPNLRRLSQALLSESDRTTVQRLIEAKQTAGTDGVSAEEVRRAGELVRDSLGNAPSTSFSKTERETYRTAIEEWMLSVRERTDTGAVTSR